MSKKGLRYVAFAHLKADGTYENGKHLSPAAAFNANANASDVKDYGDDRVVETDKSVTGGTITVELNNDDDEMYVYLLGHTQTTGKAAKSFPTRMMSRRTSVLLRSASPEANGSQRFTISASSQSRTARNATKEETVTFNHISLEGDILIPEDGNWKRRKSFDTFEAAKAYVNNLFNVTGETGTTGTT